MGDNGEQKKKDEKTDPSVIKIPTDINGATVLKNDYPNRVTFASPAVGVGIHGAKFTGVQPITFTAQPQSGILGATSVLGKNLVEMKINTIGDARNFLVGVNNVASQFSSNIGLLNAIESASSIALNHGRLTADVADKIHIPSIPRGLEFTTAQYVNSNLTVKLSESVTTVLAYGQAVRLNPIIPLHSDVITSPFFYEPQKIKIKEVEKVLPEVKKELPAKTTEAIEMLEYFQKPDTKRGDKKIITTLNEVKRAMETMLGFSAMFTQKTTTEIAITSMPEVQVRNVEKDTPPTKTFTPNQKSLVEDLVVGSLVYRKDGAILYKQTPIKMRYQLKSLCILFMNSHKNFLDYSTIKDEIVPAEKRPTTSFETITKYVSELHKILKEHFKREVIFNQEKDGYIFDTERNS